MVTVGLVLAGALLTGRLHDGNAPNVLLEAALLVLVAALPPVPLVFAVTTVTTTTTTSATATTTTASGPTALASAAGAGEDLAGLDVGDLLVAVLLLALDNELLPLPLGLLGELQEGLLLVLVGELDEDTGLEGLVLGAAQADGLDGTVGLEEGLDVELSGRLLIAEVAEALGVDAAGHGLVLKDLDGIGVVVGVDGLGQGDFALDGGVVVRQLHGLRVLEGLDDGLEGLEAAHALERMEEAQRHGVVGAAADLGQQELVHGQVGIGEVELNLSKVY